MRTRIALGMAAALLAAPVYGQEAGTTNADTATANAADPAASANAVDPVTGLPVTDNGMAASPGMTADANMVAPPAADTVETDVAEGTPARRSGGGGIPWGLLGVLGLAGLLGRKSATRDS